MGNQLSARQVSEWKRELFFSAETGDLDSIKAIARKNGKILNVVDSSGRTLLHIAASHDRASIIVWLLSSDKEGGRAAGFNKVTAKTLPDKAMGYKGGQTALHYARSLACFQEIVYGARIDNGERDFLLNSTDRYGQNALHTAVARKCEPSIIEWLLSDEEGGGRAAGFNKILARTVVGDTALHAASWSCFSLGGDDEQNDWLQIMQALLNGAKIDNGERDELLHAVDNYGNTVLHIAAYGRFPRAVEWLLSDADQGGGGFKRIGARTKSGDTALHFAAQEGDLAALQAIVAAAIIDDQQRSSLLNATNDFGWTVLHNSAARRHSSIVKWLLSDEEGQGRRAGFTNILARGNKGQTALHIAAGPFVRRDILDAEDPLLQFSVFQDIVMGAKIDNGERQELLNAVDDDGQTVLHLAVQSDSPLIVSWLLSDEEGKGRALGFKQALTKNNKGQTALHLAAVENRLAVFQAIVQGTPANSLEREELLLATDADGKTAWHIAATKQHTDIVSWIISTDADGGRAAGFSITYADESQYAWIRLFVAIRAGNMDDCKAIVVDTKLSKRERKELLNIWNSQGYTMLHHAVNCHQPSIINWLLSKEKHGGRALGFDSLLSLGQSCFTALDIACELGDLECCRALVDESQTAKRERNELLNGLHGNNTCLHQATYTGRVEIISWLLSKEKGEGRAAGFNSILTESMRDGTALHIACGRGDLECCRVLVDVNLTTEEERKQMLNCANSSDETVLHTAVIQGHIDIVSWLLSSEEGGGRAAGLTSEAILARNTFRGDLTLSAAVNSGSVQMVRALLSGFTIDERRKLFSSECMKFAVLQQAQYHSDPEMYQVLLEFQPNEES